LELIVGLFWSHKEDGGMKVRFHLESVALGDGLVDLVVLLTICGQAGVEGDVFVRAVRVIASTGIFFVLKNRVLFVWRILLDGLTLVLQRKLLTGFLCFTSIVVCICPSI